MVVRAARLVLTLLLLVASACSSPAAPDALGGPAVAPTPLVPSAGIAAAVAELTNEERTRVGLAALRIDARLMQASQIQADQNAQAGRLAHVMPESRYPSVEDRLAASGYRWSAYGENIAFGQRSAEEVVAGWMASAGHRANILSPNFTELGVGSAADSSGRIYYAQVFGRPRSE